MLTTKSKVQNYLGIDIDSSLTAEVTNWIAIVTAWINKYTDKNFEAGAAADRFFDGNNLKELLVDSFVENTITSVEYLGNDGSILGSFTEGRTSDFVAYPLNKSEKTSVLLLNRTWPLGKANIKINARWGVSITPPSDIELVATKLVGNIIDKSLNGGKVTSTQLGDQQLQFATIDESAEAMGIYQILDMYREIPI